MYGMAYDGWLLMPSSPIRTSRASIISWMVPPYDPVSPLAVSCVAKNVSSFFSRSFWPP